MSTILEATSLTQRFGRKVVLDDVSLALDPGTVTVLLGPNGAGKSTFLRLALGLLKPKRGDVRVLERNPRRGKYVRQHVGYVPDRPDCYPWMTGSELFRFLSPQYPTWDERRATVLSERLRVPLGTRFKDMSRGEGMKCMFVAAVAHHPELLLLDEPFGGLDPLVREEVLRAFLELVAEEETTALVATHDLDVAARVADRIALLAHGRIEIFGTVEEVLGTDGEATDVPAGLRELFVESRHGRLSA